MRSFETARDIADKRLEYGRVGDLELTLRHGTGRCLRMALSCSKREYDERQR